MFGKMNTAEIEQLLRQQLVGRIGCHVDGLTYVVPVSYAYDGDYIYCHTHEGMKINMMRKNPDVCFEIDSAWNYSNWQSVIGWGSFEELAEGPERTQAIAVLRERKLPMLSSETMHLGLLWPFHSGERDVDGIIFRIQLKEKTGRYETTTAEPFFAT